MKKTLVVAAVTAVTGVTSLGVAGLANAATSSTNNDPMSSLVDAIASKFKLNKTDVQKVFDEQRQANQAEREAEAKTELAQLVTDGKLTQDQADKITAKRAEMQKEREANKANGQRPTDTEMETKRTALDKWFTDNNIPTDYRYLVFGGGHGRGHGPDGDRGTRGKATQQSTTTTKTSSTNQ